MNDKKYWIGQHQTRGFIVVDCSTITEDDSFPVYFETEDRIAICKRSIMRKFCSDTGVSEEKAHGVLRSYLIHINFRDMARKNRQFLATHGISFSGIKRSDNTKPPRITKCWNCHNLLESNIDFECIACNWILCSCGACGCPRINRRNHDYFDLYDEQDSHEYYSDSDDEVNSDDVEPWTDTSDSWVRSDEEGWYYDDDEE